MPISNNPADCASRGVLPQQFIYHDLWWDGPSWLCPRSIFMAATTSTHTCWWRVKDQGHLQHHDTCQLMAHRQILFTKCKRVLAWTLWLMHNLKPHKKHSNLRLTMTLQLQGLYNAEQFYWSNLKVDGLTQNSYRFLRTPWTTTMI